MADKIKLLYMGDYVCSTGFGTVSRNIIDNLHKTGEYDIDVLGINYNGDPYDHEVWKGNVYPAMPGGMLRPPYNDVYGRQRMVDLLAVNNYDVVMILQDTFVIKDVAQALREARDHTKTSIVFYYPVDSTLDKAWVEQAVEMADFPVVYTQFGRHATLYIMPQLEDRLSVIYHGTNTEDFFPIEDREEVKQFRHKYFDGAADDKFLVMNVARNQIRKDILHSLLTIMELRKTQPEAILYLHMAETDQGGSIHSYAAQLGLVAGVDYIVPAAFNKGLTVEDLNMLYNMADAVLMTSHGEGWGLPLTEAFATKTPVVAPKNTSITEIGSKNRAILIDCNDYTTYAMGDNCRVRPVIDYRMAAAALDGLIKGELKPDIDSAYRWATEFTWEKICTAWDAILHKAAALSQERRRREKGANMKFIDNTPKSEQANRAQRRKQERQNRRHGRH